MVFRFENCENNLYFNKHAFNINKSHYFVKRQIQILAAGLR